MPELPEVETTRRGIEPHIKGQNISKITVRDRRLRWPVIEGLEQLLQGQTVHSVDRRAKYLLLRCDTGTLMIHLGMSGRLRVLSETMPPDKHDHIDIECSSGDILRFTDPRRFGAFIWTEEAVEQHSLIHHLGPEPLSDQFDSQYLFEKTKGRNTPIKTFLMNGDIVVGVGNIYANEALFLAEIHPATATKKLTRPQINNLVEKIKFVLNRALDAGGTTLKDFRNTDGKPGYFAQELNVYGRVNEPCNHCGKLIQRIVQAQRATYFCPQCQPK